AVGLGSVCREPASHIQVFQSVPALRDFSVDKFSQCLARPAVTRRVVRVTVKMKMQGAQLQHIRCADTLDDSPRSTVFQRATESARFQPRAGRADTKTNRRSARLSNPSV